MTVSEGFLDMLRDLMEPLGRITVRRMFGGASLYADGVLFAIVDDDALYLKGDATTAQRYEAEGLPKFTYEGKNGPVSMSYWRAPERLLDDADEMCDWARAAIASARRTAAAKARSNAKLPSKRKTNPRAPKL